MLEAVLLDLDDTLIYTETYTFFPRYLNELGKHSHSIAPPAEFIPAMLADFQTALAEAHSANTLYDGLLTRLEARYGMRKDAMQEIFDQYYLKHYRSLSDYIKPLVKTETLLGQLFAKDLKIVLATNPGLPFIAIQQRAEWGGVPLNQYDFELVTSLEIMHYGKPHAEYYSEILSRLDVSPGSALMIGDDWDNDIVGAAKAGLHTYWISLNGEEPSDLELVSAYGTHEQLVTKIRHGWLEELQPTVSGVSDLIIRLKVFPAAIDALARQYPEITLISRPSAEEWSVRDVLCHLCNYAEDYDPNRLKRIVKEENPFLPVVQDAWANAEQWHKTSIEEAVTSFAKKRKALVDWLLTLDSEVWQRKARHAIFGPTTFCEMITFIMEHDRTHYRQMLQVIEDVER